MEKVASFGSSIIKLLCTKKTNQASQVDQVLVQSGYELYTLNHLSKLSQFKGKQSSKCKLISKKCSMFTLNQSRKKVGYLIVITKSKEPDALFFSFDTKSGIF